MKTLERLMRTACKYRGDAIREEARVQVAALEHAGKVPVKDASAAVRRALADIRRYTAKVDAAQKVIKRAGFSVHSLYTTEDKAAPHFLRANHYNQLRAKQNVLYRQRDHRLAAIDKLKHQFAVEALNADLDSPNAQRRFMDRVAKALEQV